MMGDLDRLRERIARLERRQASYRDPATPEAAETTLALFDAKARLRELTTPPEPAPVA